VLCFELQPGVPASRAAVVEEELRLLAQLHPGTTGIRHFLHHRGFPVDIRHNAKIGREKLAAWAAKQGTYDA
jgi:hypothetical protein